MTDTGDWVSPRRSFLFPVKALSRVFRGKFVAALRQNYAQGRFAPAPGRNELDGPAWTAMLAAWYGMTGWLYAKPAPGGPVQVLDYLAHYRHKVAVSNHRITGLTGLTDGVVSFRVRHAQRPKAGRLTSLPAPEFIRRFFMHALPK